MDITTMCAHVWRAREKQMCDDAYTHWLILQREKNCGQIRYDFEHQINYLLIWRSEHVTILGLFQDSY